MNFFDLIKEETIIVCSFENKKKLLIELNNYNKLFPIKFLTLNELYNSLYFSYDKKTLYNVIKKYNVNYDIAKEYLDNLIFINNYTSNTKIDKLVEIKRYLLNNNLLTIDDTFKEFIKNRKIIFYGFDYIDKFMLKTIKSLNNEILIVDKELKNYNHDVIEFNHIEDEVEFVASSICELINKNVPINNIKITNINDEYYDSIKRIFNMYHLNINLDDAPYIFDTLIGKIFIDNYDTDLNKAITKLSEFNSEILNQIIDIINTYSFINDKNEVKQMIIHDLKNTKIKKQKYVNSIEVIDYNDSVDDEMYVFMLNFNQGIIPRIIKNETYLSDNDKIILDLDTSVELSKINKQNTIKAIKSIKNLIITYKRESYTNSFLPSNLIDEMNLKVEHKSINMSYSNLANKVRLCKNLDKYYKYNIKSNELNKLYNNYNIPYKTYNNQFTSISINSLNKIMPKLVLSYSSMQNYNECAFKFYINNVLKLDPFESTFSAFIGSLFHFVLEKGINNDIDVLKEIDIFIKDKELNAKELFFVNKLSKDIVLILNNIKDNLKYTKLTNIKTENRFEIKIDETIFKGFIDKLMTYEIDNNYYVAIIDYKTYDTDINLDLIDYGLNIQLPIYLYLVNKSIDNVIFTGFYVQKILTNEIKYDENISLDEQKINNMKLLGYSNSDRKVLELFDNNYEESKVVKGLKLKSDDSFASTANVLSNEEISQLIEKVEKAINGCILNIKNAEFTINPKNYKENNISCKYCKYKDICYKKTDDEVILKVGEEDA